MVVTVADMTFPDQRLVPLGNTFTNLDEHDNDVILLVPDTGIKRMRRSRSYPGYTSYDLMPLLESPQGPPQAPTSEEDTSEEADTAEEEDSDVSGGLQSGSASSAEEESHVTEQDYCAESSAASTTATTACCSPHDIGFGDACQGVFGEWFDASDIESQFDAMELCGHGPCLDPQEAWPDTDCEDGSSGTDTEPVGDSASEPQSQWVAAPVQLVLPGPEMRVHAASSHTISLSAMLDEQSPAASVATSSEAPAPADEAITTLMVRNLPKDLTQQDLMQELNHCGFDNLYDFCYLPRSLSTGANQGFAFINFTSQMVAGMFIGSWHRQRRFGVSSREAALSISPAELQGLARNVAHWNQQRRRRIRNPQHRPFVREAATAATTAAPAPSATPLLGAVVPIRTSPAGMPVCTSPVIVPVPREAWRPGLACRGA